MKELLEKIREARAAQKCQIATEAHQQVGKALPHLEDLISRAESSTRIEVFDYAFDEIEEILDAVAYLLSGLSIKEISRIKNNLESDYKECLELGRFYEWLNPDGHTYTGDYGEFAGTKFELPTRDELIAKLKPAYLKKYWEMEKAGLEPTLQITPIALKIRTLAEKIDAKKSEPNSINTTVWNKIKDENLQYAAISLKTIEGGNTIEIKGGKNKSQWVIENKGYLIDIVPMKQQLDADPNIKKNSIAIQAEKYFAKAQKAGETAMSCESYLLAQMRALYVQKPLDSNTTFTVLPDSSLRDSQVLSYGYYHSGDSVHLQLCSVGAPNNNLRMRCSVRVLF